MVAKRSLTLLLLCTASLSALPTNVSDSGGDNGSIQDWLSANNILQLTLSNMLPDSPLADEASVLPPGDVPNDDDEEIGAGGRSARSRLVTACAEGNLARVQRLLRRGHDPNSLSTGPTRSGSGSMSALVAAATFCQDGAAALLLEHGADASQVSAAACQPHAGSLPAHSMRAPPKTRSAK